MAVLAGYQPPPHSPSPSLRPVHSTTRVRAGRTGSPLLHYAMIPVCVGNALEREPSLGRKLSWHICPQVLRTGCCSPAPELSGGARSFAPGRRSTWAPIPPPDSAVITGCHLGKTRPPQDGAIFFSSRGQSCWIATIATAPLFPDHPLKRSTPLETDCPLRELGPFISERHRSPTAWSICQASGAGPSRFGSLLEEKKGEF